MHQSREIKRRHHHPKPELTFANPMLRNISGVSAEDREVRPKCRVRPHTTDLQVTLIDRPVNRVLPQTEYLAKLRKLAHGSDRKAISVCARVPLRPDEQEFVVNTGLHITCVVPYQHGFMQSDAELVKDWIDSTSSPANRQIAESRSIERDVLTALAANITFEGFRLACAPIGHGML